MRKKFNPSTDNQQVWMIYVRVLLWTTFDYASLPFSKTLLLKYIAVGFFFLKKLLKPTEAETLTFQTPEK